MEGVAVPLVGKSAQDRGRLTVVGACGRVCHGIRVGEAQVCLRDATEVTCVTRASKVALEQTEVTGWRRRRTERTHGRTRTVLVIGPGIDKDIWRGIEEGDWERSVGEVMM